MKIIFFGSDQLGIPSLQSILDSEHELAGIVTIPDQKKGRGRKLQASPVKQWALEHNVAVLDIADVNEAESIRVLKSMEADLFLVASFGTILSDEFINIPRFKCINIHPSLLPKYRGASPVTQTLLNGDIMAGTTIIEIVSRLDAGDILAQESLKLSGNESDSVLFQDLAELSADLVMRVIRQYEEGSLSPVPQNESEASYCRKIKKEDGRISWDMTAGEIHNKVRALSVWPGVRIEVGGQELKLMETSVGGSESSQTPGRVAFSDSRQGLGIQCRDMILKIHKVQPSGKPVMDIGAYLNGKPIQPGLVVRAI